MSILAGLVTMVSLVFSGASGYVEQSPLLLAAGSGDVQIVNVNDVGQSCGLDPIETTSSNGPTTLTLAVNKSVAVQVSATVQVEASVISASLGFNVTKGVSVTDTRSDVVPAGKFVQIDAMPLYQNYTFEIMGSKKGTGLVRKPVGVCFTAYDPGA